MDNYGKSLEKIAGIVGDEEAVHIIATGIAARFPRLDLIRDQASLLANAVAISAQIDADLPGAIWLIDIDEAENEYDDLLDTQRCCQGGI